MTSHSSMSILKKIQSLQDLMLNPIMVSLDLDDPSKALDLAARLQPLAGAFKIGPRLLLKGGASMAQELAKKGPLFIDFKFFDIPSTTAASVEAAFDLGATFVTVHALNGKKCLRGLAELEKKLNQKRPFQILGVTILTSFSEEELSQVIQKRPISSLVQDLTAEMSEAGLSGLVCSAHELSFLAEQNFFKVTPGIRLKVTENKKSDSQSSAHHDQVRTMEPAEALRSGAHGLVVGRPIIESPDPVSALKTIVQSLPLQF